MNAEELKTETNTREDQYARASETLAILNGLKIHPGWKEYEKFLDGQVTVRRDQYELTEAGGLDGLIDMNITRGEIAGLRLARTHLDTRIEVLQAETEALRDLLKATEDDQDG